MSVPKNVLQLFTQPLQSAGWYAPPSKRVCAAIRQLHQTSTRTLRTPAQPLCSLQTSQRTTSTPWTHPQLLRQSGAVSTPLQHQPQRHQSSTSSTSSPSLQLPSSASPSSAENKDLPTLAELEQQRTSAPLAKSPSIDVSAAKPEYLLEFTCKKCSERSSHRVSKQAYHGGTVLVQCPGCKVRHLIADHLGIFSDKRITLEDIMAEHGETIRKGKAELNFVPNGEGVMEVQSNSQTPESK